MESPWSSPGSAAALVPSPHPSGGCRGCSGSSGSAGITPGTAGMLQISLFLLFPWRLENKSSAETHSQHREGSCCAISCCVLEKYPCSGSLRAARLRNSQNPKESSSSPLFPTPTCACQGELGGEINSIPVVSVRTAWDPPPLKAAEGNPGILVEPLPQTSPGNCQVCARSPSSKGHQWLGSVQSLVIFGYQPQSGAFRLSRVDFSRKKK